MKLAGTVLLLCSGLLSPLAGAESSDVNQQLAERLQAVQAEYHAARQAIIRRLDQELGIDYNAWQQRYQEQERLYREQRALVEKMSDEARKRQAQEQLAAVFMTQEYHRYTEARMLLDNELERNHLLMARSLQAYEGILDTLIDTEPLLRYFFHSSDYRSRYGLLLKRVVWVLPGGESASTVPLSTYTMFADRVRTPFLIKVTPAALTSLAFLRSILIHELNHVLLSKEPVVAGLERSSSFAETIPTQPAPAWYSVFFNLRYGRTQDYQDHLLQEWYAFKAQLLYDNAVPPSVHYRLPPSDRQHLERLYQWASSELRGPHQQAIVQHPDPPIVAYFERFPPDS